MWKVVLKKDGDAYDPTWSIPIGPAGTVFTENSSKETAKHRNLINVRPERPRNLTNVIGGHPRGYWMVEWIPETTNEFGPISP